MWNRAGAGSICFSMEANYLNLFYAGILYGQYSETGKKLASTGLSVKKLGREFPYLLGKGRGAAGRMLIYYALLPQYSKKARLSGKPVGWKRDTAIKILERAEQRAAVEWGCREQMMAPELGGTLTRIPLELLAVCLYRQRPFDRLCLSLPEDAGEYDLEQALELMTPYLPRMRQVVLAGGESPMAERLETYLYEEFGIILMREAKTPRGLPWVDLREEEDSLGGDIGEAAGGAAGKPGAGSGAGVPGKPGGSFGRGANGKSGAGSTAGAGGKSGGGADPGGNGNSRRISRMEALKFLDTVVKNGYNTVS